GGDRGRRGTLHPRHRATAGAGGRSPRSLAPSGPAGGGGARRRDGSARALDKYIKAARLWPLYTFLSEALAAGAADPEFSLDGASLNPRPPRHARGPGGPAERARARDPSPAAGVRRLQDRGDEVPRGRDPGRGLHQVSPQAG